MRRRWLALLAAAALPAIARAQDSVSRDSAPRGVIRAQVADTVGKPVEGAEIVLRDSTNTTVLKTVRSSASGVVAFTGLKTGVPYVVSARKVGFDQVVSPLVRIPASDTLELEIEFDNIRSLNEVVVRGRAAQYVTTDRELGKHPIENMRLGEALRRYDRTMMGDPYRCFGPGSEMQYVYVNGVRWNVHGAAYHPLGEIFASDITYARYYNCWEKDGKLRNSLVILLKPGVEFPAKNYGEAQREPTRPPKKSTR